MEVALGVIAQWFGVCKEYVVARDDGFEEKVWNGSSQKVSQVYRLKMWQEAPD